MGETIVLLRNQKTLQFAAEELAKLLKEFGGAEQADISTISGGGAPAGKFVLGTYEDFRSSGISLEGLPQDAEEAGEDAYAIAPWNGGVLLAGATERAVLFAVYAFAREQWKVSFPFPNRPEPTGGIRTASWVPAQPIFSKPLFARRGFVIENVYDANFLVKMIDWMAKNRVSELFLTFMLWDRMREVIEPELDKRGMTLTLGGHSMRFFLERERNEAEAAVQDHPYHSRFQFDYEDESWQEEFCERIARYCAAVPLLTRVSMWPEDVGVQSGDGSDGSFIAGYIRFTERLKRKFAEKQVNVEVEHIAYNAGLSWEMLERKSANASAELDTLFAYWGRDYSESYPSSTEEGARAYAALQDWRQATAQQGRKLTIFEYYSDHFMMSWLFPALAEQIAKDVQDYRRIGADGIVDLIVPYVPKPNKPAGTVPMLEEYDWQWIHGYNSFIFASLTWGDSLEEARDHYLRAYAPEERPAVEQLLSEIERVVAPLTRWNVPLFKARAADPEKAGDTPHGGRIADMYRDVTRLSEQLPALAEHATLAMREFHAYVSGLVRWAAVLEREWRERS